MHPQNHALPDSLPMLLVQLHFVCTRGESGCSNGSTSWAWAAQPCCPFSSERTAVSVADRGWPSHSDLDTKFFSPQLTPQLAHSSVQHCGPKSWLGNCTADLGLLGQECYIHRSESIRWMRSLLLFMAFQFWGGDQRKWIQDSVISKGSFFISSYGVGVTEKSKCKMQGLRKKMLQYQATS